MNRFPLPPGSSTAPDPNPLGDEANGRLTEGEAEMIMRTTLLPEHRVDPNVIKFIANYMRCRSKAQAAREAGLDARAGMTLISRPDIYQCIVKLTEKSFAKYGFDASEVVERVKEISEVDPAVFFNPDGTYKENINEIPAEARRAIKSFKVKNLYEKDPNGIVQVVGKLIDVELWDKMKAHDLLGREKDLFKEKKVVEHDVTENMASVLLESKARAEERKRLMRAEREDTLVIEARKVSDGEA